MVSILLYYILLLVFLLYILYNYNYSACPKKPSIKISDIPPFRGQSMKHSYSIYDKRSINLGYGLSINFPFLNLDVFLTSRRCELRRLILSNLAKVCKDFSKLSLASFLLSCFFYQKKTVHWTIRSNEHNTRTSECYPPCPQPAINLL